MKSLLLIFMFLSFLKANDFDFFDDNEKIDFENNISNSTFILKLSYENNEDMEEEKKYILFNHIVNKKDYYLNYEIFKNTNDYNINLKEFYYNYNISKYNYLNFGRINIKEGIATSFNPSDYFKSSKATFDSLQNTQRRDNRLGSILLQNTYYLNNTTIKFIYSPKINTKKNSFLSNKEHYGLNLDITNNTNKASLYIDFNLLKKLSSSLIIHKNDDGLNFATNLSYSFNSLIFYNENSLKKAHTNIYKALKQLNLSSNKFDISKKIIYENVFGLSYTSLNNIVTNLEYIKNNSGMNKNDWQNYFILQKQNKKYKNIRKYHSNNEQMISNEQLFLRVVINEIVQNSDLSFMYILNPNDKSYLTQAKINYKYKENIIFNLSIKKANGDLQSEFGNINNTLSFKTQLEYYF